MYLHKSCTLLAVLKIDSRYTIEMGQDNYFENRIPLKPALGSVCSLANYSVAYKEVQSNRVSDSRDLTCSLFPKEILFDFYSKPRFFQGIVCFECRN